MNSITNDLSVGAQIFLALEYEKLSAIRKIAAHVAVRYWMEMHRWGECTPNIVAMERICKRFRVGDYVCAMAARFPIKR